MATVYKKNGITGEVILKKHVASLTDGMDAATELLSIHLVEFDQVQSKTVKGVIYYSIMHMDGTYAPVEVQVRKR